ncbi:MAG TPA: NADH-quinone oxidoreductase subunit J [Anaerolineaceae bacterium]
MTLSQVFFLAVAAITLFAAVMVVSTRRIMHAALWLVLSLFGVAVLFALLQSGFFAVVQVVVYIGAIAILIIFAVMLTRQVMLDVGPQLNRGWWIPAVLVAGLYAALVGVLSTWSQFQAQAGPLAPEANDLSRFGQALVDLNAYVIPFEIASVLLLGALIGSIFVASERKG